MSRQISSFFISLKDSEEKRVEIEKRKKASSSSDSDTSPALRQNSKKIFIAAEEERAKIEASMEEIIRKLQETLHESEERLRRDIETLGSKFQHSLEKIESSLFDISQEVDSLKEHLSIVKKENQSLRDQNQSLKERLNKIDSQQNDAEQYGRLCNLRVFNVAEKKEESTEDCLSSCCKIFCDLLGVVVKETDLEAAHRVGRPVANSSKPRPIIVRFCSRRLREKVMANKKKLKGKKISVTEDLTVANYKLEREAYKHSASIATWSRNGKIFAKLKNGKTVNLKYGDNVNAVLTQFMI